MKVQYHTSCGDHIPLTLDISTESQCIPELETVGDDNDNLRVNWSKMSADNLEEYTRNTDLHLNGVEALKYMFESVRVSTETGYRHL